MKKAIILVNTSNTNHNAGPKAQTDISMFLSKHGFKSVMLSVNNNSAIFKLLVVLFNLPRLGATLSSMDEVIIQYPMSAFLMRNLIKVLRKKTNAKIYCVIHDIESLRLKKDNSEFRNREISLLNKVDGLIVHNSNMLNWLKKSGLRIPAVQLDLFDYGNSQHLNEKINYERSICFAGNLSKSTFLNKFHPKNFELYLYGTGLSSKVHDKNIHYQGSFDPDDLPKYLTQSFGLMWDGNSVSSCSGIYGQYTKYNAPHKVSLYLSCGMPVIVWKKAGVADYIVKNHLGLAVESLTELDDKLDSISFEDYKQMKLNCLREAQKLRSGYFITNAITRIEDK